MDLSPCLSICNNWPCLGLLCILNFTHQRAFTHFLHVDLSHEQWDHVLEMFRLTECAELATAIEHVIGCLCSHGLDKFTPFQSMSTN